MLGTASHFCEVVVLKLRTVPIGTARSLNILRLAHNSQRNGDTGQGEVACGAAGALRAAEGRACSLSLSLTHTNTLSLSHTHTHFLLLALSHTHKTGIQDKEKLLAELQGHYTPLKAELAKGTSRADAQLQQDLRY